MKDLGDENVGITKRSNLTAHGKKMDMIGYIHDDVFKQTRLLPPGVTVKVRFVRATEQFRLISTKAGYKTEISSAILYEKKCKVNPEVRLALASVHKKNNMYFPIKRVNCKVFTIPDGLYLLSKKGSSLDSFPRRLWLGVYVILHTTEYITRIRSTLSTLTSPILLYTLTVSQTQCLL